MAHDAILKIEKKEFGIGECEYEFKQPMNDNGQPAGKPSGGEIRFSLIAPHNDELLFHDWMQKETETKDGTFIFTVVDVEKQATKTVSFEHAYCTQLREYIKEDSEQMLLEITISASKIAFGENEDVVFE